ncbi:hypothetical protein HMPREF0345_0840 [Enterococcus faecalis ATCC 29200]|uniref:Uncharacterized protein n=3 Tax=Enterococcus faecalis TaxID=1351 RepID=A0A125W5C3_ENTFL|nr:hypothetical protein OG1RF_10419 [Enterococcus faecalis OG1RF]EEN72255.1 hypothetical protein HMPREF0345_0840 [Enterococcus faecalis ATCC 29200]EEN74397.1 hypothetical protein HMPREF0349_1728 [Enterococcus faecalis TX1322]EFM68508.1 hypothetical protein HMPREF9509_00266 [Enterococcus faecalis TX0411]EFM68812.1 hypothetical protein HMPREF9505_02986 [Enterococcus faecalis TX0109]EFM75440.1 hypothetical protein HMPREF9521_02639 [Enterococcus faecalis TX2134]EFM79797.1 hypothetical protein HMP
MNSDKLSIRQFVRVFLLLKIKKRTNFRMFLLTKLAENDMIKGGEKEGKR